MGGKYVMNKNGFTCFHWFFFIFQTAHPTTSCYFSFHQTMWEIHLHYGKDKSSTFASFPPFISWGAEVLL